MNFNMIYQHLLFFAVGIVQDIIITYYYQMIAKEHPVRAAITSAVATLVNLIILYKILTGLEDQVFSIILAYAVGNGVGTILVMKKGHLKKYLSGICEK